MNHVERATDFCIELAKTMQALSFSSDAIEGAIIRVARGKGLEVDTLVLPGVALVEVRQQQERVFRSVRLSAQSGWHLSRVKRVLRLVERMSTGERDFADGLADLERIRARSSPLPTGVYAAAYVTYSATIAVRIGGSWLEMIVAGCVAALLWGLSQKTRRSGVFAESFFPAFAATCLALGLSSVLPSFDLRTALFGGIALLVPATAMTIGSHEIARSHLESGTVRLVHALLRFVLLGSGITAALLIFRQWWTAPVGYTADPVATPALLGVVTIGACALTLHLRADARDLPWVVCAVLVALGAQTLAGLAFGSRGTAFVAALVVGALGYLQARLPGHVPAVVIVPGVLLLVPGLMATRGVLGALAGAGGDETLLDAVLVILHLLIGLGLAAGLGGLVTSGRPTPLGTSVASNERRAPRANGESVTRE